MVSTRLTYGFIVAISVVALVIGCLLERWPLDFYRAAAEVNDQAVEVVQDWYRHALVAERNVEGFRGPVVARMYAYMGIAAYETAYWKSGKAQTFKGTYPLWTKPEPADSIIVPVALNACFMTLMELFMLNAPYNMIQARTGTHHKWRVVFEQSISKQLITRSEQWGRDVARAVFEWSSTDSVGHMAQLHNYDKAYSVPQRDGIWKPTGEVLMPPLLPHWGSVRAFGISLDDIVINAPPEYCEIEGSTYYTEVYEVYALTSPLSDENMWIAEFWSDDHTSLTFTPAGRWISITSQVVEMARPDLRTTLETYLKVGIALSDAIVFCWHGKYIFMTERPVTFIHKFIAEDWQPLHDTPPFPAYPSGHSTMGAAVAEVLTGIYGDNFRITDRSHAGRQEFKGEPRSFSSFFEMAHESAFSRIALGVHIRSDCEEGLRLGSAIGKKVAAIPVLNVVADSSR